LHRGRVAAVIMDGSVVGKDRMPLRPPQLNAHRRIAVIVALGLLLAGGVFYGIRRNQHDLDVVTGELRHAERVLHEERVAVSAAGERRREAEATLDRTLARLAHERQVRGAARALFDEITAQLAERRQELRDTSSDLEWRAKQLDYLNFCLAGVAKALNEASYDADARAVETLRSFADVCALARKEPA